MGLIDRTKSLLRRNDGDDDAVGSNSGPPNNGGRSQFSWVGMFPTATSDARGFLRDAEKELEEGASEARERLSSLKDADDAIVAEVREKLGEPLAEMREVHAEARETLGDLGGMEGVVAEARDRLRDVGNFIQASDKLGDLHDALLDHPTSLLCAGCAASFLLGFKLGRSGPAPWTRLTSVADIPPSSLGPSSPFLRGRAVSVSDGDTIRFLHAPTVFHPSKVGPGEKVSSVALPIRVCTIDTPEVAKFGKPGQPFGEDAKAYLQRIVENGVVRVRLLQKDQYGRAVAEVRTGPFWPFYRYVDEQMLKAGLAEVYRGSGAVYGGKGKEVYVEMEDEAKESGIGMWSEEDRESAAEFKARMKAST